MIFHSYVTNYQRVIHLKVIGRSLAFLYFSLRSTQLPFDAICICILFLPLHNPQRFLSIMSIHCTFPYISLTHPTSYSYYSDDILICVSEIHVATLEFCSPTQGDFVWFCLGPPWFLGTVPRRNHWLVVWNMTFIVPIYLECHHPNWLSWFSEGLKPTTNRVCFVRLRILCRVTLGRVYYCANVDPSTAQPWAVLVWKWRGRTIWVATGTLTCCHGSKPMVPYDWVVIHIHESQLFWCSPGVQGCDP